MTKIKKGRVVRINWPRSTNQDAWLKMRADLSGDGNEEVVRLGASEVSVATGSNTFQCPQRLFHKLTGFYKKDFINEILVGGHLMEPITASRWEGFLLDDEEQSLRNTLNGIKVRKIKKAKFFLQNTAYPYLNVSLDYVNQGPQFSPFTGEKYPTLMPHEMKATNKDYYKLWPGGIARPYLEQLNIQMLVANVRIAVFHVMIDGRHYKVMEVERDDDLLEEILPKIEAFVENAKKGKRLVRMMNELLAEGETEESDMYQAFKAQYDEITPEAIGIDDNLDLVYELHEATDKESDQLKDATLKDQKLLESYLAANEAQKEAEKEKIRIRCNLVEKCGKWQGIWGDGVRMINRRADPENGKKAYFDIRKVGQK